MQVDTLLERMDQQQLTIMAADVAEAGLRALPRYHAEYPRISGVVRLLRTVTLGGDVDLSDVSLRIIMASSSCSGNSLTVCEAMEQVVEAMRCVSYDLARARRCVVASLRAVAQLTPETVANMILWRMTPDEQIAAAITVAGAAQLVMESRGINPVVASYLHDALYVLEEYKAGAQVWARDIESGVVAVTNRVACMTTRPRERALAILIGQIAKAAMAMPGEVYRHVKFAFQYANFVRPWLVVNVILGQDLLVMGEKASA